MPPIRSPSRRNNLTVSTVLRQPKIPRPRFTSKPARDSCLVRSRLIAIEPTVQYPDGTQYINPPLYGSGSDPGGAVLRNYQYYVMNNARIIYTPTCGTTTSGQVWMAYFNNPELVYKMSSYSASERLALARSATHSVVSPVWQAVQLNIPMGKRRPKYSVDSTPMASIADADRCYHGVVVIVTSGTPTTEGLGFGSCTLEYEATGYEVQNQTIANI
nr:structural protein [Tolivirales sp.]